ncbi:MAG: hypothetical protein HYX65_08535 [Gemmatimonadetes bacterium]|nr:hypothetical protein [Gemmatimonadota bacterium]
MSAPSKGRRATKGTRAPGRTRPTNLSLDVEAALRGEAYSRLHATTLSRLVSDFLLALPVESRERPLSPAVRRLVSLAGKRKPTGPPLGEEDYRAYLLRKYGGR